MAAEVKIKGDTRDAQAKIKQLQKEVDRLDKACRKPKKVNVSTPGIFGSFGAGFAGSSGAAKNIAHYGSMVKMGAKGIGMAASTALGTFIGSALGEVVSALIAFSPAILRATTGLTGVGMRLQKFMSVLETYGHPEQEALKRANNLDALDDERRNHRTATLSEEAGYSRAWTAVAGSAAPMMLDKVTDLIGQANSGVMSEMLAGWGVLDKFGIKQDDLTKPVWEVVAKMLKAYNDAGLDGQNELEPAMQKLFSSKYMGIVRKLGDGTEFLQKSKIYAAEAAAGGIDAPEAIKLAGEVEELQDKAAMRDLALPAGAYDFARQGANNVLDTATLRTMMLGASKEADEEFGKLFDAAKSDMTSAVDTAASSDFPGASLLKKAKEAEKLEEEAKKKAEELKKEAEEFVNDTLNAGKEALRTLPKMPQIIGGDKVPGLELSRELIAPGTYKVTSFDY